MYCPECGMQATDSVTFWRSCGSNLSLVSQALTGNLVAADVKRGDGKRKRLPTAGEAITWFFSGLGFVAVALATLLFAPAGRFWWYWMLIPAFSSIGRAVAVLAWQLILPDPSV